ncbi:MAG: response regulator [Allorhizobium sp.]
MTQDRDTILIVEDDVFISMDAADTVASTGTHVITAETVRDALEIIESGEIRAAILDFHVLDGVITPLVARLEKAGIPYRIVSGSTKAEIAAEGISLAFCSQKPADYLKVLNMLNSDPRCQPVRACA